MEVLFIDDGSTDGTADLVRRHFSLDPRVSIHRRPKAGKVGALNTALGLARHGIVVTVDADTAVRPGTIEKLARHFVDPRIAAVPGAGSAWRKRVIDDLGGFSADTLAEDTDLTLTIRRLGYDVRYDDEAIAYTQVPESTAALLRQRFRWLYGTLQSAWKHRGALFRPKYGSLAFIGLPCIGLFQMALPLVAPVAEIAMVC